MWCIASYSQAKPAATITSPAKATTIPKPTSTPAGKPKPVEWADLDLSAANPPLSLIIKVPKGSTVVYDEGLLIASDSSYAVVIDMSYSDMPKPIADRKKEAQENEVFKVQRFIVDKPDMLFYEVKYNGKSEGSKSEGGIKSESKPPESKSSSDSGSAGKSETKPVPSGS